MPITFGCAAQASSWRRVLERLLGRPMRMHADRAADALDRLRRSPAPARRCRAACRSSASPRPRPRARGRARRRAPPRAPGKSRWQWLSTSTGLLELTSGGRCRGRAERLRPQRVPPASRRGNTPDGAGSGVARPQRAGIVQIMRAGTARVSRHRQLIEDPGRGVGHERLGQQREPADRLGQDEQHRRHARRVGLAQRPRRLRVDVAVGRADHLEDRLQRAAQRLDRHLVAHPPEQGRPKPRAERDRRRSGRPAAGTRAAQLRWIIESTRCTRLP